MPPNGPFSVSGPARPQRRPVAGFAHVGSSVALLGAAPPSTFSQAFITSVNPPVQYGTELLLSWTSNAPAGLVFQVYVDGDLVWSGTSTKASVPLPSGTVGRIDIGTVGTANAQTSFYGTSLPAAPLLEAELTWLGGTFEGADIAGFRIYGETSPGSGINYGVILATVPAYTAGIMTDGYGQGGYGQGGYGSSAGSYSWTSTALSGGTWHFGVKAFDTAGNEGTAATTSVTIAAPPLPPGLFVDRTRLHYVYSASTFTATLSWNASPG